MRRYEVVMDGHALVVVEATSEEAAEKKAKALTRRTLAGLCPKNDCYAVIGGLRIAFSDPVSGFTNCLDER